MALMLQKQVDRSHYDFASYMTKARWVSTWHQLKEVINTSPKNVLEVGPGSGMFTACARVCGLSIKTLDLDPSLQPDYIGSADSIPLGNESIDTVCAFQVLEHMPFEISTKALSEFCRVARKAVVISLPDAGTGWAETITIPRLGTHKLILRNPFARKLEHIFDGEHYWEINKVGFELHKVLTVIRGTARDFNLRTYRVHENLYHRFFILERCRTSVSSQSPASDE